jgi:hypothetical protein
MRNPNPGKTFRSSISALKTIYYVIIGLAITEALKRTFTEGGQFLEMQIFHPNRLLLVLAFMITICRFVHGASIHLGEFSEKKHKPIVDFLGFILQGSLFYIMAIALNKTLWFLIFFFCMLFLDTIWIIILTACKFIIPTPTEKQWLKSNVIMMSLFFVLFFVGQFIDNTFSSIFTVLYIVAAASEAAYFDYNRNWDRFYFPKKKNHEEKTS